jgi:hypothetical protein
MSTAQCSQPLGRLGQIDVELSTKQCKAMIKLVGDSDLDPSGYLDSGPAPRKSLGGVLSGHMKWTLGKMGVHIELVRQWKGQGRAVDRGSLPKPSRSKHSSASFHGAEGIICGIVETRLGNATGLACMCKTGISKNGMLLSNAQRHK